MKFENIIKHYENKIYNSKLINDKNSKFKIKSYKQIIKIILSSYNLNDLVTINKINNLNLTNHTKTNIKYIFHNNILIHSYKSNLKSNLIKILGIGEKIAEKLISNGLNNIKDLNKKKYLNMLPKYSQLILKYKPQIHIKYNIIKTINNKLENIFYLLQDKNDKSYIYFTGSFRRKNIYINDIDIVISSNNKLIFNKFFNYLLENFTSYIILNGLQHKRLIINVAKILKKNKKFFIKIDLFYTTNKNKYYMIFYTTGPKQFNINIRKQIKNLSNYKNKYILNQKGLFILDNNNNIIKKFTANSEKDIFKYINLKYINPEKR